MNLLETISGKYLTTSRKSSARITTTTSTGGPRYKPSYGTVRTKNRINGKRMYALWFSFQLTPNVATISYPANEIIRGDDVRIGCKIVVHSRTSALSFKSHLSPATYFCFKTKRSCLPLPSASDGKTNEWSTNGATVPAIVIAQTQQTWLRYANRLWGVSKTVSISIIYYWHHHHHHHHRHLLCGGW